MGFFDKKKKYTTTNNVTTTSVTNIRDVGLTGAAAVDLANVAQGTAKLAIEGNAFIATDSINSQERVALYSIDAASQQSALTSSLASKVVDDYGKNLNEGAKLNAESFKVAVNSADKNFQQLVGGASTLLNNAKALSTDNLRSSEKVGGDLIQGSRDLLNGVKEVAGRVLPATKELQNVALVGLLVAGVIGASVILKKGK